MFTEFNYNSSELNHVIINQSVKILKLPDQ